MTIRPYAPPATDATLADACRAAITAAHQSIRRADAMLKLAESAESRAREYAGELVTNAWNDDAREAFGDASEYAGMMGQIAMYSRNMADYARQYESWAYKIMGMYTAHDEMGGGVDSGE